MMEVRTLQCAASACPGCLACDHQMALDEIESLRKRFLKMENDLTSKTIAHRITTHDMQLFRMRAERAEAERDAIREAAGKACAVLKKHRDYFWASRDGMEIGMGDEAEATLWRMFRAAEGGSR